MENIKIITEKGKLVHEKVWHEHIAAMQREAESAGDLEEAESIQILKTLFTEAVKKNIPEEKVGILFSGGVDSSAISFVCKQLGKDIVCYTAGTENSEDMLWSSRIAEKLRLKHKKKILGQKDFPRLFKKTANILGRDFLDVVNLGVGSVELAAIELAEKDGITKIFTGLGSEEIFAGYQRHENSQDINSECWAGLNSMWRRDFNRDASIARATGIHFLTPFLDRELIIAAMRIPGKLKIKLGHKKYIFREAAEALGLETEFAFRPKKAAQYGSSFDKAMLREARARGFRFKREYIFSLLK